MAGAIDFSTWRVLAVDDQQDNLELFRELLGTRGVTAELVDSGQQALDVVETFQPTLILLDLAMPDMDGWTLLQALRARPALDGVPIVAVTSLVRPLEAARLLKDGFDGAITKPFRVDQFFEALVECYQRAHGENHTDGA